MENNTLKMFQHTFIFSVHYFYNQSHNQVNCFIVYYLFQKIEIYGLRLWRRLDWAREKPRMLVLLGYLGRSLFRMVVHVQFLVVV